jgi:hypothetical protein
MDMAEVTETRYPSRSSTANVACGRGRTPRIEVARRLALPVRFCEAVLFDV